MCGSSQLSGSFVFSSNVVSFSLRALLGMASGNLAEGSESASRVEGKMYATPRA